MKAPITTRRFAGQAAVLALALLMLPPHRAAAQTTPATFSACYVPSIGAIYMIKRTGLPQACLGQTHVEITWTDGAGAGSGTITAVTAGDGLTGGGTTGAVSLAAAFGGPGSATTVARSDHTHERAGTNNTAVGVGALGPNTTGGFNTAMGTTALSANVTGISNTAFGSGALRSHVDGEGNTAVGVAAQREQTTGGANTAIGWSAMRLNLSGTHNAALGVNALFNHTDGTRNTGIGAFALSRVTSGVDNVAIGQNAGTDLLTGSRNIYVGNRGLANESDVIRIGAGGPAARTYLAGIHAVTTDVGDAIPVLVSSTGQLGTTNSSRRFKEDIRPLGDAGRRLMELRPVSFRYVQPATNGSKPEHYGLIAEEVAEAFPELVAYDSAGVPLTVYYHVLPVLLLDQLQRQERELAVLRETVEELRAEVRRVRR